MAKKPIWEKFKSPVEENEFFIVKENDDKSFTIYHKGYDTVIECSKYVIKGASAIYKNFNNEVYLYNEDNMQKFGQGNSSANMIELTGWTYKIIDGNKELVVKYLDEKGYKFIRLVDEQGNLYKRNSKKKLNTEIETLGL